MTLTLDPSRLDLVVIYSQNAQLLGKTFSLDTTAAPISLGRGPKCSIVLDGDFISRDHARLELRGSGWWVVDQGSTSGTFVNNVQVQDSRLKPGDRLKLGSVFLALVERDRGDYIDEYRLEANLDGLTGIHSKRYLLGRFESEQYSKGLISLALFDLDRFRAINDTHGHLAGDQVLRHFASLATRHRFRGETLARYGGEEFVLLMPGVGPEQAVLRADALRLDFAAHPAVFEGQPIALTVSAGVYSVPEGRPLDAVIKAADERLYQAKRGGGNRVVW